MSTESFILETVEFLKDGITLIEFRRVMDEDQDENIASTVSLVRINNLKFFKL
jgi:hypothetical protein